MRGHLRNLIGNAAPQVSSAEIMFETFRPAICSASPPLAQPHAAHTHMFCVIFRERPVAEKKKRDGRSTIRSRNTLLVS